MSENINNREYRKKILKNIISQLHEGKSVDDVKKQFEENFKNVSASEISEVESLLISEGLPVEEVQRLCDVHASVFKGSIEEIHQQKDKSEIPGHPANTLKLENSYIKKIVDEKIKPFIDRLHEKDALASLKMGLEELKKVDKHYLKKENNLFPYMEKYGITAPPKVMWGVDDEIRNQIKDVLNILQNEDFELEPLKQKITGLCDKVIEMIFKEENIMLPMLLEVLTLDEWKKVYEDNLEIGYIIDDVPVWNMNDEINETIKKEENLPGVINLPTGMLKVNELNAMLNTLPFDITFVDKNDVVVYFSEGKERIFPRRKSVIGRKVSNCHPPASVHIVEKLVEDFKSGKKDHEDFYIKMQDKFVLIRYFAVKDENNEYIGVLEVTQDIKPIQEIKGEKRLISD